MFPRHKVTRLAGKNLLTLQAYTSIEVETIGLPSQINIADWLKFHTEVQTSDSIGLIQSSSFAYYSQRHKEGCTLNREAILKAYLHYITNEELLEQAKWLIR